MSHNSYSIFETKFYCAARYIEDTFLNILFLTELMNRNRFLYTCYLVLHSCIIIISIWTNCFWIYKVTNLKILLIRKLLVKIVILPIFMMFKINLQSRLWNIKKNNNFFATFVFCITKIFIKMIHSMIHNFLLFS